MKAIVTLIGKRKNKLTHVLFCNLPETYYASCHIRKSRIVGRGYTVVTEAFSLAAHGNNTKVAMKNLCSAVDEILHRALQQGEIRQMLKKYGWVKQRPHFAWRGLEYLFMEEWHFEWYDRENLKGGSRERTARKS